MRRWLAWLKLSYPRYVPVAIGASVLLIPWFYLSWNLTAGQLTPALHLQIEQAIAGAVEEAAPTLSLHAVITTSYQQWISHVIGRLSPVFTPAVRWKNQLYYTLLGTAGSDRVVVGSRRQLLELPYLVEFCSRDLEALRTTGEAWAARIRQLQDFFDMHGKLFLYVITPSKVAQYPRIMPDGYTCPAGANDRTNKLKLYDEILTRHGVRFVDTASFLTAVSRDYPIGLFSRGGTHWNSLGAALGTQTVIAAINAPRRDPLLAPLDFTWRVSFAPLGADRDLLDLMNLPYPDSHYPVPELTYQSTLPTTGCHPIMITEIGGSFLFAINGVLGKLSCPPVITDWFYWDQRRFHYAEGQMSELPVDAAARANSLLDARVILLEENEAGLPGSPHGEQLMQEVATLTAMAAASATPPAASPPPPPR